MTLYAFSAENWKRPKTETSFLMSLLRTYLKHEVPLMNDHNIRLRYIGRFTNSPCGAGADGLGNRTDLEKRRA